MNAFGVSDVGLRREVNEDRFIVTSIWGGTATLMVVCDGMGGHKAGEIASEKAISAFSDYVVSHYCNEETESAMAMSIRKIMTAACFRANALVCQLSARYPELAGMGTTLVAAIATRNRAYVMNIGDSRAYSLSGDNIELITRDHSFLQYLLSEHKISEQEAKNFPHKNVITRAIGITSMPEPDFFPVDLTKAEYLLFCTDGLSNCVSELDLVRVICAPTRLSRSAPMTDIQRKLNKLVDLANKAGGNDNCTAILAKI